MLKIKDIFLKKAFKLEWNYFIDKLINNIKYEHNSDGSVGICYSITQSLPKNIYYKKVSIRISRELNYKFKSIKETYRFNGYIQNYTIHGYYWHPTDLDSRVQWLESLKLKV